MGGHAAGRRPAIARFALAPILLAAVLAHAGDEQAGAAKLEEARDLVRQAHAHRDERRFDEAVAAYQKAIAILEGSDGARAELATALNELGVTQLESGRAVEAVQPLQRGLRLRVEVHGGDHPEVAQSMSQLASALDSLGQPDDAIPLREQALAMYRRLFKGDHADVATGLNGLATTLYGLGRPADALPLFEEALAMQRRLSNGDDPAVATSLNNRSTALRAVGRNAEALAVIEESLAMFRRLYKGDHPDVATSLTSLATALYELGRPGDALPVFEEALAMTRRLMGGDHPDLARSISNVAATLIVLGRHADALPRCEEALAIWRRTFNGDHPDTATGLCNLAATVGALGRHAEALPLYEESLAMRRRLFNGDHPDITIVLNNLAHTLAALGRPADALPLLEDSLAMTRRLFNGDHPDVAWCLNTLAYALSTLGRKADALPLLEEALAMHRRLFEGDHADIAESLSNLGTTLGDLDRDAESLAVLQEALEIWRRIYPGDHPHVALGMSNVAATLGDLGRNAEALALDEEALAMRRRLFDGDHPDVVLGITKLASSLDALGRRADALPRWREAAEMGRRLGWPRRHFPLVALGTYALDAKDAAAAIGPLVEAVEHLEALRSEARSLGAEEGARYAAEMRRVDPFPPLVEAKVALGAPEEALGFLERGRARAVLDLLEAGRGDLLAEATARAGGDAETMRRLESVQRAVTDAESAVILRGDELARARAKGVLAEIRAARDAESEARRGLEKATRDRLHALRDVLPEMRPLPAAEMQRMLEPGERMLVYGLSSRASFVFLVRPDGVEAFRLEATLGGLGEAVKAHLTEGGPRLFQAIVPAKAWAEVKAAKRVYVLPHGPLHRVPFETLVVDELHCWVDEGPPIAYAASGSVLAWLKSRRSAAAAGAALVAVGDPRFAAPDVAWPENGLLVHDVVRDGQAAALGLRSGDVLVRYGEKDITDFESLRTALGEATGNVPLRFVREGEAQTVEAKPGKLGVLLAKEPPRISGPALVERRLGGSVLRAGELVPLPGTRREVQAIHEAFGEARAVTLFGADATEERLFDAAKGARFLHLATHGIVNETQSASFSALALARPRLPVPGDDGFLTLADLLERWRGRLDGTSLVVLSACDSQKGRLERDEGMLALPLGFCFAGAPAVVASLWKVDDESTALLMSDFYRRILSDGAPGPCEALHAARRELKKKHPDPRHWGAFVFVGAP